MHWHFPSSDNRKGSWMQYAALEGSVPPWHSSLRGQSNETLSPESFSRRFSVHHPTSVAVLAASGNSTSNAHSAMLQLMVCGCNDSRVFVRMLQSQGDASQTANLVPPWSLLSKLPLRAEEHLSMTRSVLRKKTEFWHLKCN